MPLIRLLTSVVGGAVEGAAGDVVEVDRATARVWADGIRAEFVTRGGKAVDDKTPDAEPQEEPAATPRDARPPITGERAVAPPVGEQR